MFARESIRYGNRYVRLLCAAGVGCLCLHLFGYGPITALESGLFDVLGSYGLTALYAAGFGVKAAMALGACLVPALLAVERPVVMVVCAVSYAAIYAAAVGYVLTLWRVALPLAVPVIGIFASSAVMETMAWSEERFRRRQLERVEKARQHFTDMLAHDLRRRLSSILTSLSLLRKSVPADAGIEELMTMLGTSADRMLIQINALLDIRRIQEGRMTLRRTAAPLQEMLEEVLREYRPTSELVGVAVDTSACRAGGVVLQVDRDVVSRVIANLLWNALRHAPAGTVVGIGTSLTDRGGLELSVENDSDPIPPSLMPSLFQSFVSGSTSRHAGQGAGTGLGLTFCRMAIEVHDGTIRIESPVAGGDRGVKVIVAFPPSAVLRG